MIGAALGGLAAGALIGVAAGLIALVVLGAAATLFCSAPSSAASRGVATVKVELLYFDGCPSHERFLPRLRELVAGAGIPGEVQLRRVESPEAAVAERFLGSPTVRVNGIDVEPGADSRSDFGLKCRLYSTPDGLQGMPRAEWVVNALAARKGEGDGDGHGA